MSSEAIDHKTNMLAPASDIQHPQSWWKIKPPENVFTRGPYSVATNVVQGLKTIVYGKVECEGCKDKYAPHELIHDMCEGCIMKREHDDPETCTTKCTIT
jgi:hypothetical protein